MASRIGGTARLMGYQYHISKISFAVRQSCAMIDPIVRVVEGEGRVMWAICCLDKVPVVQIRRFYVGDGTG